MIYKVSSNPSHSMTLWSAFCLWPQWSEMLHAKQKDCTHLPQIHSQSIHRSFYMTWSVCNQSTFPEIIKREATICCTWATHSLLSLPKGNLNRKLLFPYQTELHLPWLQVAWLCSQLGMKPFTPFQPLTQLTGMMDIANQSQQSECDRNISNCNKAKREIFTTNTTYRSH